MEPYMSDGESMTRLPPGRPVPAMTGRVFVSPAHLGGPGRRGP